MGEIRGALDIGSSQHKLLVACMSSDGRSVEYVIHQEQIPVYLNDSLQACNSTCLPHDVLQQSHAALHQLITTARALGAVSLAAVATAVFRRAANGQAHLDNIHQTLGLHIQLVSQHMEGELGFWTACAAALGPRAASPTAKHNLISWDSGGGSFQLATLSIATNTADAAAADDVDGDVDGDEEGGVVEVYQGMVGNADVLAMLRRVQGGAFSVGETPNPVQEEELEALLKELEERLGGDSGRVPGCLRRKLGREEAEVIGIGNHTSLFCVARDAVGREEFCARDVMDAVRSLIGRDDNEISARMMRGRARVLGDGDDDEKKKKRYDETQTVVPKLALLHAVMTRMQIRKVKYQQAMGSCAGILLEPSFWKPRAVSAAELGMPPPQPISQTSAATVAARTNHRSSSTTPNAADSAAALTNAPAMSTASTSTAAATTTRTRARELVSSAAAVCAKQPT